MKQRRARASHPCLEALWISCSFSRSSSFWAIFLGVRLGGIGIGYAGGASVLVLGLILGMKPGNIPWDVILIIASVIAAISAMQLAGGLDYLVQIAERILRSNPKYINYLAPVVTYVLTIFRRYGSYGLLDDSGYR